MGKNAGHKAMQAQRYSSSAAAADGEAGGQAPMPNSHAEADVTYHTPEWHAARIAALTTTRMTWDDFRKQQRELQDKEDALVGSEKAMREHRALLDAERASRLGARAGTKEPSPKKKRKSKSKERSKSKDRKSRKKSSKDKKKASGLKSKKRSKKKRRRSSSSSDSSSSSSSSDSSGSDSDGGGSGGDGRRAAKLPKTGDGGPVKLSEYLRS